MKEDEKGTNRINITPLVDVSLTLVLVFMVTMPLSMIHGVTVNRQSLEKYGLSTPQESVVVHLTDSAVFIEDENGREQKIPYVEFGVVIRQMLQLSPSKEFLLRVDRDVPHGQTVWALDIGKQNGAANISIFEG